MDDFEKAIAQWIRDLFEAARPLAGSAKSNFERCERARGLQCQEVSDEAYESIFGRHAVAHTPPAIISQGLGLGSEWVAKLPNGEAYFAAGPVPDDAFVRAARQEKPILTTHWYPLGVQQPRRVPGGGAQRTVTVNEFPISTTLSASVLEIEPGAMRELHWHPHADEWQYYLEGAAEMAVYLGRGNTVTEQFVAGDIGYVPMGAGHYIRNTGGGILRLLIGFNNGHYHSHDLNAWLASNPPDVLATNLGLPRTVAGRFLRRQFFPRPRRSA